MSALCTDPIAWEATLPIRPSSPAWRAAVKGIYGAPLDADERAMWDRLSDGVPPPDGGTDCAFICAGRRAGKTDTTARIATYEARHGNHGAALAPGQQGRFYVVAPLREQGGELIGYARGLAELAALKRYANVLRSEVEYSTGVTIAIQTADAVAVSGPTAVGAVIDEAAKLPGDDAKMPDREIIASLRPALAPVLGAPTRRFIAITSAYIRDGWAWDSFNECFGKRDAHTLTLCGSTEVFNPNIDTAWLERERRRVGERVFSREYLCVWQDAITDGWFGDDVIAGSIDAGRKPWPAPPKQVGTRYVVAIDQAFAGDRFALAIAHAERRDDGPPVAIVDGVTAWEAPRRGTLSVDELVPRVAAIVKRFNATLVGDQFAFVPLASLFRREGVGLRQRAWTASSKAPRFRQVRDAMADGRVRLPDDPETIRELSNIQGRLLRSGGEAIEAARGHDDRVSAVVLTVTEALKQPSRPGNVQRPRFRSPRSERARLAGSARHDWGELEQPGKFFIYSPDDPCGRRERR